MEFYILRNVEASFPPFTSSLATGLISRHTESLQGQILITKDDDGTDNSKYSDALRTAIIEKSGEMKYKDSETDWNFKISISLPNPNCDKTGIAGDTNNVSNLKVYADLDDNVDNFLENLNDTFNKGGEGNNVTLNVKVVNFGLNGELTDSPAKVSWKAMGLTLDDKMDCKESFVVESENRPLDCEFDERLLLAWKNGQEFCATLTISVFLNSYAVILLSYLILEPIERFDHLKKLLENETCTDLEIIAGISPDQKVVKCHRAILAAGSKVFQGMFESGMREATVNKIEIEEMSEKGVRAMLAYLYHRETKAAYECSKLALELLQAGEKYDIEGLRDMVRDFMLAKESEWFGLDVILTLYMFVKAICSQTEKEIWDEETNEDNHTERQNYNVYDDLEIYAWKYLKIKCLKVIKWYMKNKPKMLLESDKYREIFGGENLKLATEITTQILRLD